MTAAANTSRRIVIVALVIGAAAIGCNAILGIDGDIERLGPPPVSTADGGAGAGGGMGGMGATGGMGGMGGMGCVIDANCEPIAAQCKYATCVDSMCTVANEMFGKACTENGGVICDGMGLCVASMLKPNGEECFDSSECATGFCVDGVCCDSVCNDDCQSCSGEHTRQLDGTCADTVSGTDPDGDCTLPQLCNGWGACDRGVHLWSRQYSGAGSQDIKDVAIDAASGSVVVVGSFVGSTDLGDGSVSAVGSRDGFVARYSAEGGYIWGFTFGDSGAEATAVEVDVAATGQIFVTGHFEGTITFPGLSPISSAGGADAFLLRLDATGNGHNAQRFGDSGDEAGFALEAVGSDGVIIGGSYASNIDPCGEGPRAPSGNGDAWLALFDNDVCQWQERFGGSGEDGVASVGSNGSELIVWGSFSGPTTLGGAPLTPPGTGNHVYAARFSNQGALIWAQVFGSGNVDSRGLAMRSTGDTYFAGGFSGALDFGNGALATGDAVDAFLMKAGPGTTFNSLWSASYIGSDDQRLYDVALDAMGTPALVGRYDGVTTLGGPMLPAPPNGGSMALVGKVDDSNAAHVWSHGFGLSGISMARAVAASPTGELAIVGDISGIIDWGGVTMTAANSPDGYLVVLSP